tara:strand:- start:12540 stop:13853 length:1314 start_codon:yes stop_codon:yes gene_type:complete
MGLDDEVRKHLRDTGEQVALTPGILDAVRVRAATRLRRRRRLLTGLGFLAGVALVGGSLAVILPGSNENSGPLDLLVQQEALEKTQDLVVESSDVSETSLDPSYETIPAAAEESLNESEEAQSIGTAHWVELEGPVVGATTEYVYSGDTVVARVGAEWFVRDESSWRQIEMPDSMDVIAVDLGVGEDYLRVAGWVGEDRCSRELAIKVKTGVEWQDVAVPNQLPAGLVSSITSARLRVTDHERVLSRIEQIDVDPLCLLQSLGVDAVEAEIEDGMIYATDRKAGRVVYALDQLAPPEVTELVASGPLLRSLLLRSTDENKWSTTTLAGLKVTELGVVDGLVMVEDPEYTVHDGQRLKRSEVIPPDARLLIDAFVTPSGTSMLYARDGKVWHQGNLGEREIRSASDQPVIWGRIGRIFAEVSIVAETQQGQILLVGGG